MRYTTIIASLLFSLSLFSLSSHAQTDKPQVEVVTNYGSFVIELHPEEAPISVENFLQYVEDGFYEGTIFHRVIGNFMVQGGGYDQNYRKKPTGDPITNEADNGLKNLRGTVAMSRTSDPDSATSQFFVNVNDNDFLDHKSTDDPAEWGYAVFGQVIRGMDIIDEIQELETGAGGPFRRNVPTESVFIEQVVIRGSADTQLAEDDMATDDEVIAVTSDDTDAGTPLVVEEQPQVVMRIDTSGAEPAPDSPSLPDVPEAPATN